MDVQDRLKIILGTFRPYAIMEDVLTAEGVVFPPKDPNWNGQEWSDAKDAGRVITRPFGQWPLRLSWSTERFETGQLVACCSLLSVCHQLNVAFPPIPRFTVRWGVEGDRWEAGHWIPEEPDLVKQYAPWLTPELTSEFERFPFEHRAHWWEISADQAKACVRAQARAFVQPNSSL